MMRALVTEAEALSTSLAELVTLAGAELRKTEPSAGTLQHLLATATGLREDVRVLRRELDQEDVELSDLLDDGYQTLQLWTSERGLRLGLVKASANLASLEKGLKALVEGDGAQVYVVRTGDTLQTIAARYLGGWQEWWRLVAANALSSATVAPGQRLIIPEK